jgi:MbtH protein
MSIDSDTSDHKDTRIYRAVISEWDEGYRITLADNPISPGWRNAGKTGSREEVLAWIDVVWSEYERRPKSRREKIKEMGYEDTRVYQVLIDEDTGRSCISVGKGCAARFLQRGDNGLDGGDVCLGIFACCKAGKGRGVTMSRRRWLGMTKEEFDKNATSPDRSNQ